MTSMPDAALATDRRWLVFRIAGQAYAAPLSRVSEVIRDSDVTPVPGAAPDLLGIRHLRGQIVPVMDGARRLGLTPAAVDLEHVRIVVLAESGHRIGLRVDAVGELLQSDGEIAPPPPGRGGRDSDPVDGVLPLNGGFVALLDVRRLCRLPQDDLAA